ncbi:MAG: TatD family hydrolase [Candidatus Nomurabacteria bacterium]|jgi:TatD DNase family protein|nr:TatD family hydrolase [Candidatus Nomurabacteria bacterium]
MNLIDTHCHIHDTDFGLAVEPVLAAARAAGVGRVITVGTDVANSRAAVEFAAVHDGVFAVIGIHPGEAPRGTLDELDEIVKNNQSEASKLLGLGDIGLDYHRGRDDRSAQIKLFEAQLDLATRYDLPVSFHVREAFDDFWAIFDSFPCRGTLHSFTDNVTNMEKALSRGLLISLNGILTFNRQADLDVVFDAVPMGRILLETDAPFLAPHPHRGKINQPAYVADIAACLAQRRKMAVADIAEITTRNAEKLFSKKLLSNV